MLRKLNSANAALTLKQSFLSGDKLDFASSIESEEAFINLHPWQKELLVEIVELAAKADLTSV